MLKTIAIVFAACPLWAQALRVEAGLDSFRVWQQGSDGTATIRLRGTADSPGKLEATVSVGSRKLKGWNRKVLAEKASGAWEASLALPAGGPYRIAVKLAGSGSAEATDIYVGDLWILAGQSNMVGRALLASAEAPDPHVHMMRPDDRWAIAEDPLHERRDTPRGPNGAGSGLAFAKEMYRRTGVPVGLIPCAVGGTSMDQWDPGKRSEGRKSLYGNMLARVSLAGGKVRGMLWYQGESDATEKDSAVYRKKFESWIATMRRDLGSPSLPLYYAQLGRFAGEPYGSRVDAAWDAVRDAQLQIESTVTATSMAATLDLELTDSIHVDTAGLQRLGQRFAKLACRDLYPGKCSGLEPGPRLKEVRWVASRQLRLSFTGVNGRLSAPDRVTGFSFSDGQRAIKPVSFRAWIPEGAGNEIALEMNLPLKLPAPLWLWYGRGFDPTANLHDAEDLPLPAFGPVTVPPPQ
ncbi:MAG: sialate O-acetylesterase [Bryobacteraceae bacterium]